MEPLEQLLERNYDKPVEEECQRRVIDYIRSTESVSDQSPVFVKKLTKVAEKILGSDPQALEGLEERLFQFHVEGAKLAQEAGLRVMEAHTYSHARQVAYRLYQKSGDISWLHAAEKMSSKAGDLSEKKDRRYAKSRYQDAAKAAAELFKVTNEIDCAKRLYQYNMKAALLAMTDDPKDASFCYEYAAKAARSIFEASQDVNWARRWHGAATRAAGLYEKQGLTRNAARSQEKAAQARQYLYQRT